MGILAWLQRGEATGLRWLWVSLGILLLDSFSKHWILQNFFLNEVRYYLSWFNAVYVQNPGAAFSLLADQPAWHWLLTATSLLVCGVLLINLVRQSATQRLPNLAYTLIIGGALGNLLDRWRYGAVIDFIDLHWANWHWPAFNVADSAICLGCALLLWRSFRDQRNQLR